MSHRDVMQRMVNFRETEKAHWKKVQKDRDELATYLEQALDINKSLRAQQSADESVFKRMAERMGTYSNYSVHERGDDDGGDRHRSDTREHGPPKRAVTIAAGLQSSQHDRDGPGVSDEAQETTTDGPNAAADESAPPDLAGDSDSDRDQQE